VAVSGKPKPSKPAPVAAAEKGAAADKPPAPEAEAKPKAVRAGYSRHSWVCMACYVGEGAWMLGFAERPSDIPFEPGMLSPRLRILSLILNAMVWLWV
jgi:hypothetical protein